VAPGNWFRLSGVVDEFAGWWWVVRGARREVRGGREMGGGGWRKRPTLKLSSQNLVWFGARHLCKWLQRSAKIRRDAALASVPVGGLVGQFAESTAA